MEKSGPTETCIEMVRTDGVTTNLLEKPTIDKKVKRHSIHGMMEEENVIRPHQEIAQLSLDEKKFLLAVERGDVASTRRTLQRAEETGFININCVDPLGRSALLMAIDNENLEMVELLIEHKVETKDALLHAISEEFVEAVEVLLDHEETIHKPGEPHSWEALPPDTATFTPDITPLILSAHRDNYEIIKILLDRGATLPMPHDVRCGCDECVTSRMEDSLRHSRSRINAYRALASPSLIALSSKDPILTAFELSWELRRLSLLEHEFKSEYQELRKQCQDFATALLDHTRSSYELEVLLNHDPTGPAFEHGDRMHLNRLKLAIKLRQKKEFDYVYYTGDIISHRIWSTTVEKNIEDITKLNSYFKEQFDVPVFPVFGNHEPSPLNLWASDNVDEAFSTKWLFELAAEQWSDLIGQDVSETVLKGGYYSVSPRPGFRVIGINSNLGYTDNWWLIYEDVDPFNQLQWLADELKAAEDNNESVHILSHVPTGSDSSLVVWNREFGKIVERFANTITGHFNGHTHKDEFHVFYNSSDQTQAIGVAFNGASVTPFSNSNPSFKYYEVDDVTFNLLDYEEWYFNLTEANSFGEADSVEWKKLYSFVEAYGAKNLLPSEVDKVLYRMTEDHTLLENYFLYKFRNGDAGISGGCDDYCKRDLLCNIVTTLYGSNEACNRFLSLYDQ